MQVLKRIVMTFVGVFCLLLCNQSIYAQPSISGASGNLVHKDSVVIRGSGFGTKSPAEPLWWDDFESRETDTHSSAIWGSGDLAGVISSLTRGSRHYSSALPTSNQPQGYGVPEAYMQIRASGWDSSLLTTGNGVDGAHTRSTRYAAGCHYEFAGTKYTIGNPRYRDDPTNQVHYDNVGLTVSSSTPQTILVAYWYYRLDPAWLYDDETADDIYFNHKFINLEQGYANYNNGMWAGRSFNFRSAERDFEEYGSGKTVSVETQSMGCTNNTEGLFTNPRLGWVHINHLWDRNTGIEQIYEAGRLFAGGTGCTDNATAYGYTYGGFWGACNRTLNGGCSGVNSLWFGCRDCYRYFDDLYLDNTYSRVVLANSAAFTSSTIVEPQIPTAWANGEITVTVNQGALPNGTAYLFVFDSSNNRNAVGYSVEIGGSNVAAPLPPSGLIKK